MVNLTRTIAEIEQLENHTNICQQCRERGLRPRVYRNRRNVRNKVWPNGWPHDLALNTPVDERRIQGNVRRVNRGCVISCTAADFLAIRTPFSIFACEVPCVSN